MMEVFQYVRLIARWLRLEDLALACVLSVAVIGAGRHVEWSAPMFFMLDAGVGRVSTNVGVFALCMLAARAWRSVREACRAAKRRRIRKRRKAEHEQEQIERHDRNLANSQRVFGDLDDEERGILRAVVEHGHERINWSYLVQRLQGGVEPAAERTRHWDALQRLKALGFVYVWDANAFGESAPDIALPDWVFELLCQRPDFVGSKMKARPLAKNAAPEKKKRKP